MQVSEEQTLNPDANGMGGPIAQPLRRDSHSTMLLARLFADSVRSLAITDGYQNILSMTV